MTQELHLLIYIINVCQENRIYAFFSSKVLLIIHISLKITGGYKMCMVKKYELELKRKFISNHCVATLKDSSLVDMCLFSGEGKPTLLGGFVMSQMEAFNLGNGLINTSGFVDKTSKEQKEKIINQNVINTYKLLKDINAEQAERLKELFDIKIIKDEEPKTDHGYIG